MEWSDLRIFLAIAREGTLGAAARKLGQSQPTMGRRLIALERAIGQTLFQRTKDGFVLTDEGAAVMPHAEAMEDEALAVQRRLAGRDRAMEGQLRLSSSDWFGTHVLAPVLAEFATLQPRVTIELVTSQVLMSLPRRDADLVFRIRPFDEPEVVSRRLMHVAYGLYLKQGLEVPRLGDGTGMPLVTMDTAFADMPDAVWLKKVLPNAHVVARSNNRDVQASLCMRGVGIAVLPRLIGDALSGVTRVELGEDPPGRDTWIGYHRDLRRLARLRALLDLVFARLAN
ncbi:MAG: LysR family transcriptional regulator [Burkholderiales bacterium PBB1]|nr:MAG: LysR family transcriptional regulator [Burkholderiales bacterium PBB1]